LVAALKDPADFQETLEHLIERKRWFVLSDGAVTLTPVGADEVRELEEARLKGG
jgi:hypothetical protein